MRAGTRLLYQLALRPPTQSWERPPEASQNRQLWLAQPAGALHCSLQARMRELLPLVSHLLPIRPLPPLPAAVVPLAHSQRPCDVALRGLNLERLPAPGEQQSRVRGSLGHASTCRSLGAQLKPGETRRTCPCQWGPRSSGAQSQ